VTKYHYKFSVPVPLKRVPLIGLQIMREYIEVKESKRIHYLVNSKVDFRCIILILDSLSSYWLTAMINLTSLKWPQAQISNVGAS